MAVHLVEAHEAPELSDEPLLCHGARLDGLLLRSFEGAARHLFYSHSPALSIAVVKLFGPKILRNLKAKRTDLPPPKWAFCNMYNNF